MKVNWFYIKMPVLLGVTGFLFVFALQRNEQRKIEEIAFYFDDESSPFVTREAVNKLLIVSDEQVTEKTKGNVALGKMEARVNTHPIIKNAEVYITMRGDLAVAIEQRKPIARLNGSKPFYIDEQGEIMPLSSNFSAHVPLVAGATENEREEVFILVDYLRQDAFLQKHIIGIERLKNGEYRLEGRKLEYDIILGKVTQLEKKFSNYKAFYQKALKDKSLGAYNTITLKYDKQVVCEKK